MLTPSSPEISTHCQHCKNPLRPTARFCPACGHPATPQTEADPVSAALTSPPAAPASPPAAPEIIIPQSTPNPEKKPQGKKKLFLGCGCLALLLILPVIAGALISQGQLSADGLLALIYTFTPTNTSTATPDYQATHAQATLVVSQTIAARSASETARASATSHAQMITAAFQQTQAAASQTQAAATLQVYEATGKALDALAQAAEKICAKTGVPEAAHYTNKRAFHPILIHPNNYPYPKEARPDNLTQLELVACVEVTQENINTKYYTNYSTHESGYTCHDAVQVIKITVRAADTGQPHLRSELRGSKPTETEKCGMFENFPTGQKEIVKLGSPVDTSQIWEKVKGMVFLELKSAFFRSGRSAAWIRLFAGR